MGQILTPDANGRIDFASVYGRPREWLCPDCGCLCTVYPELPFRHVCTPAGMPAPRKCFCYWVFDENEMTRELVVENPGDPDQTVETLAPDGTPQLWRKRWVGDKLVFLPPDGYLEPQGFVWRFDPRLQVYTRADDRTLGRAALRGRVGVIKPAGF